MRKNRFRGGIAAATALLAAASLATGTPGNPAQDDKPAGDELPKAADLLTNHVEARGGEAALKQHRSMTLKGMLTVPGSGYSRTYVEYRTAPTKLRIILSFHDMTQGEQCFDGKVGWTISTTSGTRLVKGADLKSLRQLADFHADLHYRAAHKSMKTIEETTFAGEACYKVRLVDQSGLESFEYFSVSSGLRKGIERMIPAGGHGTRTQTTTIEEYQGFEGMLIPVKYTTSEMMASRTITITDVTFDTVDPSVFDQTPVVKQLINSEKDRVQNKQE